MRRLASRMALRPINTRSLSFSSPPLAIQLMKQRRIQESKKRKLILLTLLAITLGGCGIWCMHFTGMNALNMELDDGTLLEVDFEVDTTIVSFIFPVVGVFIELKIASADPFFLEVEQSRRKGILAKGLQNMTMESMVKRNQVGKKIKFFALFSRLGRIAGGSIFAALDVLGMHCLSMIAQRTSAVTHWDAGIIVLSSVAAFVAAFWILFRALTFWSQYESLRIGSALIMGVAVCGTHYVGMGAALYEYLEENFSLLSRFVFPGHGAADITSHGSILACCWLSTFTAVISLRKQVTEHSRSSAKSQVTSNAPEPNRHTSAATNANRMKNTTNLNSVVPAPPGGPPTAPTTSAAGPRRPNIVKKQPSLKTHVPMPLPQGCIWLDRDVHAPKYWSSGHLQPFRERC